ncbi:uncharacterized protein [Asterias amurensis]|uniref:uncharacterized protein n=1 Tax=Asterias amurensis TaxID=7602 RepID=UPI003AB8F0E5
MASQSSQESVASRQGKVTTIIPERSRATTRRRLAKRQTTLRAFTFVRDWEARQSPLARVFEQKDDDDAASSSRSSVTISPSPQVLSQASSLSSSGRPRVSPGPIIIASPSLRSRPSSQKKTSSHASSNLHRSSRRGVVSDGGLATSILGHTPSDSSAAPVTSPETSVIPPATSTPASDDDPSMSHEGSSQGVPSASVEGHDDSADRDESATPSVTSSPVVSERATVAADQTADSSQSQMGIASPDVTVKGRRSTGTPLMQWRNDQSRFLTPGEKSMSIITKTPKSGPVSRQGVSRRRKLSPPPEGDKQQTATAPGAKKAKVRLWSGNGRRRLATDVTDLDIVLNTLEQVTADYKKKLESSSQRRALTKFFYIMKKELVDKIDLSQEYKVLKSALTRMTATTRKQTKRLLLLQQENARLNSRIRELKNNSSHKKDEAVELHEISTFLTDLQQLHQDLDNTVRGDETGDAKPEFSSPNIGPLLTDVKGSSRSAYSLRSVNNQLEKWLEAH